MQKHPSRLVFAVIALLAALFASGCAEIAQGLSDAAYEIQRQQAEQAYYDSYAPRPPADASARGIK